jgi:hypothetical protein
MTQRREPEKRRLRLVFERPFDGTDRLFDLSLGLIDGLAGQVGVRPGVRANGMAAGRDLAENFRVVGGVLADGKERRLDAFVGQRLEHGGGGRPGAVVEGQHHLVVAQEVVHLEMLESEAGSAGGVDFDGSGHAERVRIGAFGLRRASGGRGGSRALGRRQRRNCGERRRGACGVRGPLRRGWASGRKRRRHKQNPRDRTTHETLPMASGRAGQKLVPNP